MKFICEREKPMRNWIIHPGIYDVEIHEGNYRVGINKFPATKEELLDCGYFDTIKYWFSYMQSGNGFGFDVNYVLVDGKWLPYSEMIRGKGRCNWDDAELIAESDVGLPIKYGGYELI